MKIYEIQENVDQAELAQRGRRMRQILRAEKFNDRVHIYQEYYSKKFKQYRETNRALEHRRDIRRTERKGKTIAEKIAIMATSYHEDYTSYVLCRELSRCLLWATECPRAVVTPKKLVKILKEIMINRINRYYYDMEEKKKLMCIVGQSGSGKTLASLHLKYKLDANVICSFTNRPPRPTEVEGRDHHFINIYPQEIDILAITKFGGYLYYALKDQVFGDCTVYVIDEDGLRDLIEANGDEYRIFKVYIDRSKHIRYRDKSIGRDRTKRDKERTPFDPSFYDYIIENNTTKRHLFESIEKIYHEIVNKE